MISYISYASRSSFAQYYYVVLYDAVMTSKWRPNDHQVTSFELFFFQNTNFYQFVLWIRFLRTRWSETMSSRSTVYNGSMNCPPKEFRLHSFRFRMLSGFRVSVQISYIEHRDEKFICTMTFESDDLIKFLERFRSVKKV